MLKRTHKWTFHQFSPKHLNRYIQDLSDRHTTRAGNFIHIMVTFAKDIVGKRLHYSELVADNRILAEV